MINNLYTKRSMQTQVTHANFKRITKRKTTTTKCTINSKLIENIEQYFRSTKEKEMQIAQYFHKNITIL